ncbi:MAG TPA: 50S ribosomal protein L29 [Dehalococcoidia bacterium]|nr:50S ribosomal protein L29 [Dehalococcoidia bacterium]
MAKKLKTRMEEIHKLSDSDLTKEIEETYRSLFSLRLQVQTRQQPNHRQLPVVRRQIARLKTVQRLRALSKEGGE